MGFPWKIYTHRMKIATSSSGYSLSYFTFQILDFGMYCVFILFCINLTKPTRLSITDKERRFQITY